MSNVTNAPKTKKSWVKHIHEKGWGGNVRARIKFRKYEGREPTEDEEDELGEPGPEEVTTAEIREAFDKGEEVSFARQSTSDMLPNQGSFSAALHVDLEVSGL